MKKIAVAGSVLVDKINEIDAYPTEGELVPIRDIRYAVGGCVPNVAIDIKKLDGSFFVTAIGRAGDDEYGRLIVGELEKHNVKPLLKLQGRTSFTEVMSVRGGQRTFFCYTGANREFGYEDVNFEEFDCDLLHLGYFLLLDKVDGGDGERILREAKERGIRTSIDLVSENSGRYAAIRPCLRYVDNLIVNETEAGALAGMVPRDDAMKEIARVLKGYGVGERVIVHSPAYSVCLSEKEYTVMPSFELPKDYIRGTTGAGDAFLAGCLIAIAEGKSDGEILETGTLAATSALSAADAVSGVKDIRTLKRLYRNFERRKICS